MGPINNFSSQIVFIHRYGYPKYCILTLFQNVSCFDKKMQILKNYLKKKILFYINKII